MVLVPQWVPTSTAAMLGAVAVVTAEIAPLGLIVLASCGGASRGLSELDGHQDPHLPTWTHCW